MGAGKTAVLGEASDVLALRHITHAAIDLDALGLAYLPSAAINNGLMYRNLQSVSKNYDYLGVRRLLLARAMEDHTELELCRGVVSAKNTVVCRLTASNRSNAATRQNARIRCIAAGICCSRREIERHSRQCAIR